MTAININDPVIEKIIQQQGIENITTEILTFIKDKLLPHKENNNKKSKAIAKSFLALTQQTKSALSKSYTAKEAKEIYHDSQL